MNHKEEKISLVKSILKNLSAKKDKHYKKFKKFKKITTFFKCAINGLNAVSVSSLVITLSGNPITLVIGLVATSLSTIGSAILTGADFEGRYRSHQVSFLQYQDINRDINGRLLRNNLTSLDLDVILTELNNRIGLIEDSEYPISS